MTEKMDGENTTLHRDLVHARSLEPATGPDSALTKALWGSIAQLIPNCWHV